MSRPVLLRYSLLSKFGILIFLLISFTSSAIAQDKKGIIYSDELVGFMGINTNGWEVGGYKGKVNSFNRVNYYQVSFKDYINIREKRQSREVVSQISGERARPYKLGKINNFFALEGIIGKKRFISDSDKEKGVAVGINYAGGVSIGFLKPYYLQFSRTDSTQTSPELFDVKYSEETDGFFRGTEGNLYGASGFSKGLDEISIVPGVSGKVGLFLDWGAHKSFVKMLEAGLKLDVYSKNIQLSVTDKGKPYFITAYLNFNLGKRWYKG